MLPAQTLPLTKEPVTLTYRVLLYGNSAAFINDANLGVNFAEIEKRTGVHITWVHPPLDQQVEQKRLMAASGDVPDLIYGALTPGNDCQADIDNGLIIPVNELVAKYPGLIKTISTDKGQIVGYPVVFLFADTSIITNWAIRIDWLQKLGLKVPETIDDWRSR